MSNLTPQMCEAMARSIADDSRRSGPDNDLTDPRVPPLIFERAWAAATAVGARMAPGEPLLDFAQSYSYTASFKVKVAVTLLVATDRAVWFVRDDGPERDGDLPPTALGYRTFRVKSKLLTTSVSIESGPEGPVVTAQSSVARWLEQLNATPPTRPSEAVSRLVAHAPITSLPSAAWQPDPTGRHQLRYWDGTAWTPHVSDGGVAGTDPV